MANLSFETPGTTQGSAADWTTAANSLAEGIGIFNETATTFDPTEGFEKSWYLPMHVHMRAASGTELVVAPDASDLATALVLTDDIAKKYRAHLEDLTIHLEFDHENILYFGTPTLLSGAIAIANTVKGALHRVYYTTDPQGHLNSWPGAPSYMARSHRQEDVDNRITAGDASDLSTLLVLANQLKSKLNAHMQLVAYWRTNDSLGLHRVPAVGGDLIEFTGVTRETGGFAGVVTAESFERGWAIPDLVPAKVAEQDDLVDVDHTGLGLPWYGGFWGSVFWDGGVPLWPGGHEQLLDDLDFVALEVTAREHFEEYWSLPGSGSPTNDVFWFHFWDPTTETWSFASRTATGILDTFESGWKSCEVGYAAHWSGTEWRFLQNQLEIAGFGSYTFGSFDLSTTGTAATAVTTFSPGLAMVTTIGFMGNGYFQMDFTDGNGAAQTCYWFVDNGDSGESAPGDSTTQIGLTTNPADPRYEFLTQFSGIRGITSLTPNFVVTVGKVEWRGSKGRLESFSTSDWTLTSF